MSIAQAKVTRDTPGFTLQYENDYGTKCCAWFQTKQEVADYLELWYLGIVVEWDV